MYDENYQGSSEWEVEKPGLYFLVGLGTQNPGPCKNMKKKQICLFFFVRIVPINPNNASIKCRRVHFTKETYHAESHFTESRVPQYSPRSQFLHYTFRIDYVLV